MVDFQLLANGELLIETSQDNLLQLHGSPNSNLTTFGIARADGTLRSLLPSDASRYLYSLPNGDFVDRGFDCFDLNGVPKNPIPAPTGSILLAVLPDKRFLTIRREFIGLYYLYTNLEILHQDGSLDTSFNTSAPLPVDLNGVTNFEQKIYLVVEDKSSYPPCGYCLRIIQINSDGTTNETFNSPIIEGEIGQITATDHGIYIIGRTLSSSSQLRIDGKAKPFGLRLTLTGELDSTYAPEEQLEKPEWSIENPGKYREIKVFTSHGFSVQLALDPDEPLSPPSLWLIPPFDVPSKLHTDIQWLSAKSTISPGGEVFIAGEIQTQEGSVQKMIRYSTQPELAYSTPRLQALAQPSTIQNLEATFAQQDQYTYQWNKDEILIPGSTSPAINVQVSSSEAIGSYTLIAKNAEHEISVGPFEILAPAKPSFLTQPQNNFRALQIPTRITSRTSAAPSATYQWYRDGIPIPGANSPTYFIVPNQIEELGTYQLRASNSIGHSWSESIIITTNEYWSTNTEYYTLDDGPGTSTNQHTIELSSTPTSDGSILFTTSSTYIDDTPTGPIGKMSSIGKIDPSFDTRESLAETSNLGIPISLSDNTILAPSLSDELQHAYLLDSNGALISSFEFNAAGTSPIVYPHQPGGFLVVSVSSQNYWQLERFLFSGERDETFNNELQLVSVTESEFYPLSLFSPQIKIDSYGRIYTHFHPSESHPFGKIQRLKVDGQFDQDFSFASTEATKAVLLDSSDRIYVVSNTLMRLHNDGIIDASYKNNITNPNIVLPLPNSRMFVDSLIFDEDGNLETDLHSVQGANRPATYTAIGSTIIERDAWIAPFSNNTRLIFYNPISLPSILSQPRSVTITDEKEFSLSIEIADSLSTSFQWYKDGEPIADETQDTLIVRTTSTADAGDYYVQVTTQTNSFPSSIATITIEEKPLVSQLAQIPITIKTSTEHFFLSWQNEQNLILKIQTSTDAKTWTSDGPSITSDETKQSVVLDFKNYPPPIFLRLIKASD
ncbi:hypothetical protein VDG1235_1538 [Verrucomicrobiia bacterium DG1235]|nr:hypothetical protein VDG1235_1538 [Verrucomicrobiae bacterium DG1235]